MARMEEMSALSNKGDQFWPPSIVLQTPPATEPNDQVSGSPGTPSIASARPPRKGPICRHCIPLKSFSSIAPGGSGFFSGETAGVAVAPPPPLLLAGVCSTACPESEMKQNREKRRERRKSGLSIRLV